VHSPCVPRFCNFVPMGPNTSCVCAIRALML
jgi:hypothetical protein